MADEDGREPVFPEEGGGRSIADRAEGAEGEVEPPEPPMEGDVQLSLNVGGVVTNRNARKVEQATLRLLGGKRPVSGLLGIDEEVTLVVRALPHAPAPLEKRNETGKVEAFDLDQTATVKYIRRADADAIRDLFADLLGRDEKQAAALLDELREFVSEGMREAA
jgi:hypothetical protein